MDKKIGFAVLGGSLFIMLPLLFWGGPDWVSPPLYQQVWDFGHVIFFGLVGAFVQLGIGIGNLKRWLLASLLVLAMGITIELIQKWIGRTASAADVFNDMAGFWFGVAWAGRQFFAPWVLWLKTALIMPGLFSIFIAAVVQTQQAIKFPLLAGFDNTIELQRVRGPVVLSDEFYRQGTHSLKITFTTKKYSGVFLSLFHGDWSGYSTLAMEFYNPDSSVLVVTLRVSDRTHDRGENDYDNRFNRRLYLEPGWNSVRIPVSEIREMPVDRDMLMDEVHTLGVYSSYLPEPRVIYWDHLRLE